MKKPRYTDKQAAFALRQAKTGTPVKEVIRKMGVLEQPFTGGRSSTAAQVSLFQVVETGESGN